MPLRLLVLAVALATGLAVEARAGEAWRRPVEGRVVAGFSYDREAPFATGRRRGIDLATRPGRPVRAACTGRITWAGRGPRGPGVTVRCGRLAATHLGVVAAVRRGRWVARGHRIGRSAGTLLRLGARKAADRFGYVDPAGLLRRAPPIPPVVPIARRPEVRPVRAPGRPWRPRPAPAPGLPRGVLAGAALLVAAATFGVGARLGRRPGLRARRARALVPS